MLSSHLSGILPGIKYIGYINIFSGNPVDYFIMTYNRRCPNPKCTRKGSFCPLSGCVMRVSAAFRISFLISNIFFGETLGEIKFKDSSRLNKACSV